MDYNSNAYSFGVYGCVSAAPNPSGGVIGYYANNDYGILGYYNGSKNGVVGVGNNGAAGVGVLTPVTPAVGSGGAFASNNVGVYGYGRCNRSKLWRRRLYYRREWRGSRSFGTDLNDATGAGVAGSVLGSWYFHGSGACGKTQGIPGIDGVIGQTTATANGTGYGITTVNAGTAGQCLGNHTYTFGVVGQNDPGFSPLRSGGVIGIYGNGGYWGADGYVSSGGFGYGVYGSAAGWGSGTGKVLENSDSVITGAGGGFY